MRIACVIDNLGSGGAQRQLVNLAVGFHKRGHDIRVITYHPKDFYCRFLAENGVAHTLLKRTGPWKRMAMIRRTLRIGSQDAVLAFLEAPCLWTELAAAPSRRWGLVVSERSDLSTVCSWKGRLLRYGHYLSDAVTVNSVRTAETLACRMPGLRSRIHTIYNAVDLVKFFPSDRYVHRARGRATVVVAASYRLLKNLHGLIEGVAMLDPDMQKQLRIEWYGECHDTSYDTGAAMIRDRKLENVFQLNGPTCDIDKRMKEADAVGLFSFFEGLPNTICEGMACGKPIIMSRVSDAEALVEPGENGWLCDPTDPRSIAAALRSFLLVGGHRLAAMGQASRSKAETLFATDKIAIQYLALLARAAARRCGRSPKHLSSELVDVDCDRVTRDMDKQAKRNGSES